MTDRDGLRAGLANSEIPADESGRWPWLGACAGRLVGGASAAFASWSEGLDPSSDPT